jgi:hypothetical protein
MSTSVSEVVASYLRHWVREDELSLAREKMRERFANPDWKFEVGALETREERNARR